MNKINKYAFTLIEFIIVLTILTILIAITFISLYGYSKTTRNARRISDIENIKNSLDSFALQRGFYPTPSDGVNITYSGELAWTQGFVGENIATNLGKNLIKKPIDPLFETEYIYSIDYSMKKYELLSIYEGNVDNDINKYNPKVDGIYNKFFVKNINYFVALPSIINSELNGLGGELNNSNIDSQIISDGVNIPSIGSEVVLYTGGLDLSLYATGMINPLSSSTEKISVITMLQNAYDDSSLSDLPLYSSLSNETNLDSLVEDLLFTY